MYMRMFVCLFKQKTAYEMRISDWSSDVCSSDLFGNNYGQTIEDILWWNKRAWAAGVNIETLHGAAYGGAYDGPGNVDGFLPGVKWPGFEGFPVSVSNVWNRQTDPATPRREPDYIARLNWVMNKPARADPAIYRHGLDIFPQPAVPAGARAAPFRS